MTSVRWLGPGLSVLAIVTLSPAQETLELFNGKDLTGWVAEGVKEYKDGDRTKPIWTVEEGLLMCAGKGYGFLRFEKKEFTDFSFHVEYRMVPKCNSGIGIRTTAFDPKKSDATRPSYYSYEIQLLDDAGRPTTKHSTGSLYRYVAPSVNPVKPAPEWNVMEIECAGPRIKITLNGQKIIDVDQRTVPEIKNKPLKGFICLQNHGGKIAFRNLRVKEIAPAPKD